MDTRDDAALSPPDVTDAVSDTATTTTTTTINTGSNERMWHVLGKRVPKGEIIFFTQVIILYAVILTSIYNLTTKQGDSNLWTALLSSSLGYLLPSPTIKRRKESI